MNEGTEWVRIGKGPLQPIKVKPITLIVPSADFHERIEYDSRIEIDCHKTVEHVNGLLVFHLETEGLFLLVFKDYEGEVTPAEMRCNGMGMKHVAGLIDMSLEYQDRGVLFMWKYPESFLHPAAQVGLADVMIQLFRRGSL